MKITTFKNGSWTVFEKFELTGWYLVKAFGPNGQLIDKMRCDDYRTACEYRRAFNALAKNA